MTADPSVERPFFKVWAAKALLSDDLDCLTDHERSIWFFGLCAASLEWPRWRIRVSSGLARKCKTNPQRLAAALNKMADLGMCELTDGEVYFPTAEQLNEETEHRKPSDTPERVRQRVSAHRERTRGNAPDVTPVTPHVTPICNAHIRVKSKEKEEEEEKEQEQEQETATVTPLDDQDRGVGDPGFRDRYGTLLTALGGSPDQRICDEFEQIAADYEQEHIVAAIAACRRDRKRPYPSEVLKRLPTVEEIRYERERAVLG